VRRIAARNFRRKFQGSQSEERERLSQLKRRAEISRGQIYQVCKGRMGEKKGAESLVREAKVSRG